MEPVAGGPRVVEINPPSKCGRLRGVPFLPVRPLSGSVGNLRRMARHDYRRALVEHGQAILAHAEFGAVVVPAARVEIDEHLALFERVEESREGEAFEPHRASVPVGFPAPFGLDLGLNVEGVEQLGPGLVFKIGKTPIGLRLKLAEPRPLPHRCKPVAVPGIDAGGIEGDQHLLLLAINHHHEAAVAARLSSSRQWCHRGGRQVWDRASGGTGAAAGC